MYGIPVVLGIFAGVSAASRWQTALHVAEPHAVRQDRPAVPPRHRRSTSSTLPFYRSASSASPRPSCSSRCSPTLATSYLYGAIRVSGREVRISKAARIQIAVIAGALPAAAGRQHLARPVRDLTDSNVNDMITGAAYTDVNATIPGRADPRRHRRRSSPMLFIVTAFIGRWRLPDRRHGAAHRRGARRRRDLPVGRAALPGRPEPEDARDAVHPDATSTAPATPTASSDVEDDPVQRHDRRPSRARCAQDAQTTAKSASSTPPSCSPSFRQLSSSGSTTVPRATSTSTATRSTARAGRRGRGARAAAVAASATRADLVQRHHRLHPRLRPGRRLRQPALGRRPAGVPRVGHPDARATLGDYEPRIYFGEQSPTYSIVGAPEGRQAGRARLPVRATTARSRRTRRSTATAARSSTTSSSGSSTR